MKLKLDENLGRLAAEILRRGSHDVETVPSENLRSAPDRVVIERCLAESRCLVTLNLDFGNPLLFPPAAYAGIVVLRPPPKPTHDDLITCVRTLRAALSTDEVTGKLWMVQRGRVRKYQDPHAEE